MNPYEASRATGEATTPRSADRAARARWLAATGALALVAYHLLSAVTLPFTNVWWIGEFPVLAVVQLPKMALFRAIQRGLIDLLPLLGWNRGSSSPDLIATHPWALGLVFAVSAMMALLSAGCGPRGRRRRLIAAAGGAVLLDLLVTFWFDAASRLSLF